MAKAKKARTRGSRGKGQTAKATQNTSKKKAATTSIAAEASRIVSALNSTSARPAWWKGEHLQEPYPDKKKSSRFYCANHLAEKVFELSDGTHFLWAGAGTEVGDAVREGSIEPKLVVDLAKMHSDFSPEWPVEVNARAKALLPDALWAKPAFVPPAVLWLDWGDGDVPDGIDVDWWRTLADTIYAMDGDVTLNCVGGHGRTGTALAILGRMIGGIPADECPVEWVRTNYCEDAIETEKQIRYIEAVLGVVVKVGGSAWYASAGSRGAISRAGQYQIQTSAADEMDDWERTEVENGYGSSSGVYREGVDRTLKNHEDHKAQTGDPLPVETDGERVTRASLTSEEHIARQVFGEDTFTDADDALTRGA